MIVYFDTSALVKRYLEEADSAAVLELWENASRLAASQILYAEMAATFARKRREQPASIDLLNQALGAFREDWTVMYHIAVDDEINRHVDVLLGEHPLRGADAIHLASAIRLRDLAQDDVTFAGADAVLLAAAREEEFVTAPSGRPRGQ